MFSCVEVNIKLVKVKLRLQLGHSFTQESLLCHNNTPCMSHIVGGGEGELDSTVHKSLHCLVP